MLIPSGIISLLNFSYHISIIPKKVSSFEGAEVNNFLNCFFLWHTAQTTTICISQYSALNYVTAKNQRSGTLHFNNTYATCIMIAAPLVLLI